MSTKIDRMESTMAGRADGSPTGSAGACTRPGAARPAAPRGGIGWFPFLLLLVLALFPRPSAVGAANITEPSTLIYGRIYQRLGNWEFNVTEGNLRWTIANLSLPGKRYEMTASLRPLGDGQYSYLLRVPHEVLAYDLEVSTNSVPLTSGGFSFQHLAVTVDGQTAVLQAPAVATFSARQSSRAASYRIDLDVPELSPDSDGDGLPDWWEDRHGTDKWDAFDGPAVFDSIRSTDVTTPGENQVSSFGTWRKGYFPTDTRALEIFATEDPDRDGVNNLLEYAFGLHPLASGDARSGLPHLRFQEGRLVLEYLRRKEASDLKFEIESSSDLIHWTSAELEIDQTVTVSDQPGLSRVTVRSRGEASAGEGLGGKRDLYLRVSVSRRPLAF